MYPVAYLGTAHCAQSCKYQPGYWVAVSAFQCIPVLHGCDIMQMVMLYHFTTSSHMKKPRSTKSLSVTNCQDSKPNSQLRILIHNDDSSAMSPAKSKTTKSPSTMSSPIRRARTSNSKVAGRVNKPSAPKASAPEASTNLKNAARRARQKQLAKLGKEVMRQKAEERQARGEQPDKKCHLCREWHWVRNCPKYDVWKVKMDAKKSVDRV